MTQYKLILEHAGAAPDCVLRLEDGAHIPLDDGNADYRAFLAWQAEGGEPETVILNVVNLYAYANAKQWALATGGYTVTVGGEALAFATDTVSQGLIAGKVARLGQANPPASIKWQFGLDFVTLQAADFTHAAIQVADFVQATFDALEAVFAAIAAGTITTPAEVDAYAWPANHG